MRTVHAEAGAPAMARALKGHGVFVSSTAAVGSLSGFSKHGRSRVRRHPLEPYNLQPACGLRVAPMAGWRLCHTLDIMLRGRAGFSMKIPVRRGLINQVMAGSAI